MSTAKQLRAAEAVPPELDHGGDSIETPHVDGGPSLVLCPRESCAYAALRCYVRGGSVAEARGGGGVAHLLEHLVGARAGERMWDAGDGALLRAWTTRSYTCFSWWALREDAASSLDRFLEVLTDHRAIPARLDTERRVVLEEISLAADQPLQRLYQTFVEQAFDEHPIRHPICGHPERLKRVTAGDLREYLGSLYTAANLHLVVAGGFSTSGILAAVEAAADRLAQGVSYTLPPGLIEAERRAPRRFDVAAARGDTESTLVGFRTLAASPSEVQALQALSMAVMAGRSGLEPRLAEHGVDALGLSAAAVDTPFGAGWFAVRIDHPTGNGERAERAVSAWLGALRTGRGDVVVPDPAGCDDREAAEAGESTTSEAGPAGRPAVEELEPLVELLGEGEVCTGDPWAVLHLLHGIAGVGEERIAAAVARHGDEASLTIGRLLRGRRTENRAKRRARPPGTGERELTRRLPNGVRILVFPRRSPAASCQVLFGGGSLLDDPETSGLGHLAASLLPESVPAHRAGAWERYRRRSGADVYAFCDENLSGVSLTCDREGFGDALRHLADMALRPELGAAALEAWRGRTLACLDGSHLPPWDQEICRRLRRHLYRRHPYGRPALGTVSAVRGLTLEDVKSRHARSCVGGNLIVVAAGDLELERVGDQLEHLFAEAPPGGLDLSPPAEPPRRRPAPSRVETTPTGTALLGFGYSGIAREASDWAALEIARTLLTGPENRSLGGRLVRALHEAGCAYAVQCVNQAGRDEGYFAVLATCSPADLERALRVAHAEIDRLRRGEVTPRELETCRKVLHLDRLLLAESPRSLAYFAGREAYLSGRIDAWGTLPERLAAIGVDEVAEAVERRLRPAVEAQVLLLPLPARDRIDASPRRRHARGE